MPAPETEAFQADPSVEFQVVLEDTDFLVVEKSAHLHVHPLKPEERGTLYQGVIARYPEIARVGDSPREGGLLHRLDLSTSGLVLFARNPAAYDFLRGEFKKRRIEKEYLALVEGTIAPASGALEWPIDHHPKNKRKMKVDPRGREAVTLYRSLAAYPDASLLRIQIPTGVRHQIRVHLAYAGHAIVGDELYGRKTHAPEITRLFLHATRMGFRHPRPPHAKVSVDSPLPADLDKTLQTLSATKFLSHR